MRRLALALLQIGVVAAAVAEETGSDRQTAMISVSAGVSPLPVGPNYAITLSRVAAGGGVATGGGYSLHGTVGQHEVDEEDAMAGDFLLRGGFWSALSASPDAVLDRLFNDRFQPN
ncbi:MAG: hypothetical protein JJU31_02065 [Wenzhouxiangella sp.]|nr:hypothetical protein [Wenzhouxiangella sp.]MCH8478775.1 hypothetical protein [Wenzhouxiangella sp.]TVR94870.1 MAG: hypothetical protein EA418_08985 [Wenzhouxiangellaceae bacterium]